MTVAFVTGASETSTSTTNRVVPAPSNIVAGNLLIAILSGHNVFTINARPAGWNNVLIQNQAADQTLCIEYKIADAGDVGRTAGTWTLNTASAGIEAMLQYSGVAGSATVIHQAAGTTTANGTTHATPSIVTTINGCMIFSAYSQDVTGSPSWTLPGDNERFDTFDPNFIETTAGYDAIQATGGTISKTAFSTASDAGLAFIVAIAPSTAAELSADHADVVLSGNPAAMLAARLLNGASRAFALTGAAVTFIKGRNFIASPSSLTLAGKAAALMRAALGNFAAGSYALSGKAATLARGRWISAGPNAFSLSGIAAQLLFGRLLKANGSSYSLSGIAAALIRARIINAAGSSYSLSGKLASFLITHKIVGSPGSYGLTGFAADLTYTPLGGGAKVLSADPGSFAISGKPATIMRMRIFIAAPASFALAGSPASLLSSHLLTAQPGAYQLNKVVAGLLRGRLLNAAPRSFAMTGAAAIILMTRIMAAGAGSFALDKYDADLSFAGVPSPFTPTQPIILVDKRTTIDSDGGDTISPGRSPIETDGHGNIRG